MYDHEKMTRHSCLYFSYHSHHLSSYKHHSLSLCEAHRQWQPTAPVLGTGVADYKSDWYVFLKLFPFSFPSTKFHHCFFSWSETNVHFWLSVIYRPVSILARECLVNMVKTTKETKYWPSVSLTVSLSSVEHWLKTFWLSSSISLEKPPSPPRPLGPGSILKSDQVRKMTRYCVFSLLGKNSQFWSFSDSSKKKSPEPWGRTSPFGKVSKFSVKWPLRSDLVLFCHWKFKTQSFWASIESSYSKAKVKYMVTSFNSRKNNPEPPRVTLYYADGVKSVWKVRDKSHVTQRESGIPILLPSLD